MDEPAYKEAQAKASASAAVKTEEEEEINVEKMDEDNNTASNEEYAWFISRGAEMCDVEDGVCK